MVCTVEAFDLRSGTSEVLIRSDMHLEAPNWSRDDDSLFVNASGRLYRLCLRNKRLTFVPTDSCLRLNNDHGISPDGQTLAFCDKTETGKSCLYTVPYSGKTMVPQTPKRITDLVPSWFHGFSPDGSHLIYTCVRDGGFGIATCPVDGGAETVLCMAEKDSGHHYDGPDFTPDGTWIWFNSDRGGAMKLWRMRADGTELRQMTSDDRVDWFPHPTPDGAGVVFLSYAPGTQGHPAMQDVHLRYVSADGGQPETLLALHGGQGTLNVPSFSPDGHRFAFVRYDRDAAPEGLLPTA